jgi:hypothetical protein
LDPDSPQHTRPAACVIAQQYSSATFMSERLQYRKEKIRRALEILYFFISVLFLF